MSLNSRTKGRSGEVLRVTTNSFEVKQRPTRTFYHYDAITAVVENSPGSASATIRRQSFQIIDRLQLTYPEAFTPRAVYDGRANMFSTRALPENTYDVDLSRNLNKPYAKKQFRVRITRVQLIQPSDIDRLISPLAATDEATAQVNLMAVNLLQIIVRQAPNMRHGFGISSKSFFVPEGSRDLRTGLEAWRGYFQSVRPVLGRLLINVDVKTAAVYKPGPLIQLALSRLGWRDTRDLMTRLQPSTPEWSKLKSFLKGVQVVIKRGKSGGNPQPIKNIVPKAGTVTFEMKRDDSTTELTVEEYYKVHYTLRLQFPNLFGIVVGKDSVIPAELCEVVPGQVYRKKLSPEETATFMTISTQKPEARLDAIKSAVYGNRQLMDYGTSDFMRTAGMEVANEPIQINGRVLPIPKVSYGGRDVRMNYPGAWNVMHQRFTQPQKIDTWGVLAFGRHDLPKIQNFISALVSNLQKLGIAVANPKPPIEQGNEHNPKASLEDMGRKLYLLKNANPSILIVILPASAAPLRKEVKQWGDVLRGIPTQCVREGKWEKASDQYCNNVALKINAKLGGVNSIVNAPIMTFFEDGMAIGLDVSHPGPGVNNRPSIASMVASIDKQATRYVAKACPQKPRDEIIADLNTMIKYAIEQFFKNRKKWPQRILFYRDGVSEGEYDKVAENEIAAIDLLLDDFQQNTRLPKPKIIFVIVGKRHHIRFFPERGTGDKSGNCPAGFVVDNQIVHSVRPDFYLQSHGGLLGTSRPSHYVVLRDDLNVTADQLQELSYTLCHVYASATRSVSIPAPVYYADRVCARAEFHFHPDLAFADETATSGSEEFDLDRWKKGFGDAHKNQHDQMYFL